MRVQDVSGNLKYERMTLTWHLHPEMLTELG